MLSDTAFKSCEGELNTYPTCESVIISDKRAFSRRSPATERQDPGESAVRIRPRTKTTSRLQFAAAPRSKQALHGMVLLHSTFLDAQDVHDNGARCVGRWMSFISNVCWKETIKAATRSGL